MYPFFIVSVRSDSSQFAILFAWTFYEMVVDLSEEMTLHTSVLSFPVSFAGLSNEEFALATSVPLSLILLVASGLLAFLCLRRNKKRKENKSSQPINEDLNPVYGLYYFSDGERVDDSNAEVMDENSYYD